MGSIHIEPQKTKTTTNYVVTKVTTFYGERVERMFDVEVNRVDNVITEVCVKEGQERVCLDIGKFEAIEQVLKKFEGWGK